MDKYRDVNWAQFEMLTSPTDPVEAEGEGSTGGVYEEIQFSFDQVLPGQHPVTGQDRHVGQLAVILELILLESLLAAW